MCRANEKEIASNTFLAWGVWVSHLHTVLCHHVLGWMDSSADPWGHGKSLKAQLTSFLFSFPCSVLPLNLHTIVPNVLHSVTKSTVGELLVAAISGMDYIHIGIIVLLLYEMEHLFSSHWLRFVCMTHFWQVEICGICQVHAEVKSLACFHCVKSSLFSQKNNKSWVGMTSSVCLEKTYPDRCSQTVTPNTDERETKFCSC